MKISESVLLVVDVQVGVMEGAWNAEVVISNISKVLEKARSSQTPIVWIQHDDEELIEGSPKWEIVPALSPNEGEPILSKHFNSAFERTELADILSNYRTRHIVLVGAASNWCIRATAFGALERGYDLTLVKDAHTTEDMDMGDGTIIFAKDIIRELNVGINWVSYPDRKNQMVAADNLEFVAAT